MEDALQPSEQVLRATYEKGYRTWSNIYDLSIADSSLPWDCLQQIESVFPEHPYFPGDLVIDSHAMFVKAVSTWSTTQGPCSLPSFDEDVLFHVGLPFQIKITIKQLPVAFPEWFSENDNHITILVLAWTYILSARWAEIMPGVSNPEYSNCQATWVKSSWDARLDQSEQDHSSYSRSASTIYLGNADDNEARWWSAVLALDTGWSTPIRNDKGDILHSPWHSKIISESPFMISRDADPPLVGSYPPATFSAASGYLSNYCQLHNIIEQSRAALAAALLLPAVKYDNRVIELPFPSVHHKTFSTRETRTYSHLPDKSLTQFDRLLTMSCNPRGVKSLLANAFFQRNIDCNVCGEWLQGTFAFLDSDVIAKDRHLLARVLMKRDPTLGFLWLGAFILGSYKGALQEGRRGSWSLDFSTAAWTGTYISFIQEPVSKDFPASEPKEITRADECRLMYLSHEPFNSHPPLFPWAPFGYTAILDVELNVREHIRCPGKHGLQLKSITWECLGPKISITLPTVPLRYLNGTSEETNICVPFDSLDPDDDTSEMVTRNMFTWLREDAGYPLAEKAIRQHEWIAGWESDDDSPITGDALSSVGVNLHGWIAKTITKRSNSL